MFLLLEDEFGTINLIVPPRPLRGEPPDRAHASRCCCARAGWRSCRRPAAAINVFVKARAAAGGAGGATPRRSSSWPSGASRRRRRAAARAPRAAARRRRRWASSARSRRRSRASRPDGDASAEPRERVRFARPVSSASRRFVAACRRSRPRDPAVRHERRQGRPGDGAALAVARRPPLRDVRVLRGAAGARRWRCPAAVIAAVENNDDIPHAGITNLTANEKHGQELFGRRCGPERRPPPPRRHRAARRAARREAGDGEERGRARGSGRGGARPGAGDGGAVMPGGRRRPRSEHGAEVVPGPAPGRAARRGLRW